MGHRRHGIAIWEILKRMDSAVCSFANRRNPLRSSQEGGGEVHTTRAPRQAG